MTSEEILTRMKLAFSFLVEDFGFNLIDEKYYSENFGDAYIHLRSEALDILVTRDRSQYFCYFFKNTKNSERFDEEIILRFLDENEDRLRLIENHWDSVENSAEIIRRHIRKIIDMFNSDVYNCLFRSYESHPSDFPRATVPTF